MPLNTTNFRDVTDETVQADDVLLSVRPSTRAAREDWDTQFQRAPDDGTGSPSTDDWRTIKTVPAGQRVVRDEAVQSTTSPFFWRARHVRPGSTAGPYTSAKGGQPREGADSAIHSSLNVAQLDVITNDIGKLTAGTLANTTGTRFINLSATGNNDFIHVEDASGTTTLSIQADGDADFGGTVSSEQFTANVANFNGIQVTGNGGISGSTWFADYAERDLTFREGNTFYGEITGSTVGAAMTVIARNGDLSLNAEDANDIQLKPTANVSFEGGNLSTSATTGLGPDLYLTVNTTEGLRKLPLFQV